MDFSEIITRVFGPPLRFLLNPINDFLAVVYLPWATLCALSLFVGTMIWVFTLRKQYINVDAPGTRIWYDLRFWTVLSMLPHVIVYLYFARWS